MIPPSKICLCCKGRGLTAGPDEYVVYKCEECQGNGYIMQSMEERFLDLYTKIKESFGSKKTEADLIYGKELFNGLRYQYCDRAYHNLDHIKYGLDRLEEMEEVEKHRGSKFKTDTWNDIYWAFWFHDYYNDEAESAIYATNHYLSYNTSRPEFVKKLILATNHKYVPSSYEEAIICDADLSILGSSIEEFDAYEAKVRQEYKHIPDHLFAAGRYQILTKLSSKPHFFWTETGRNWWETKARRNVGRSMSKLVDMMSKFDETGI